MSHYQALLSLLSTMPDQVSCKLLDPQRTKDILYEFSRQEPHTIPSSYALLHDSPLGASLQDEPNATTVLGVQHGQFIQLNIHGGSRPSLVHSPAVLLATNVCRSLQRWDGYRYIGF
ncbi:hypothetical protein Pst134EB_014112 [Puccinia striiformis f. sp. tritici]|nr:hypothetical protein Pst134EB_014112 [Puccinia striiformis f. sp. tritici]